MGRCENMVGQNYYRDGAVAASYIELRCGSTGVHGQPLQCDECQQRDPYRYECRHGVPYGDVSPSCYRCEFGED